MIEQRLQELLSALPENSSLLGSKTVREVCLTVDGDGSWSALAGGHRHVHIGEWGGDFRGDGDSAAAAISACLAAIKAAP